MKKRDILFLLVSSVILVIAWIVFTIIHNSISSTINETTSGQISPIAGSFDIQTITNLKKREQVESLFVSSTSAAVTPTTAPVPSPTPISFATSSASLIPNFNPTPTATQGGTQ